MRDKSSKKIIFFYLFKELSLYFVVSFLFFFLIFFVNNILLLAEDILSKNAPAKEVLLLMLHSFPFVIANAVPFAALVGSLMCIGRFVNSLEFLALYSLGFSMRNILAPILCLGCLITLFSFFTNDILLPASSIQQQKIFWRISTTTPSVNIDPYSIKRSENATLISGQLKNNTISPLLIIERGKDNKQRIASAKTASISGSTNTKILMTLSLKNSRMLMLEQKANTNFNYAIAKQIDYNLLTKNIKSEYFSSRGPMEMSSKDLYLDIQKKKAAKESPSLIYIYSTELHKKFAIPAGALFFMLFAFSISATGKITNQSIGFILGLLVSVAYWAIMMIGQSIKMTININSALIIWLPNILLLVASLFFLGKRIFK